jgi:formate hydrogenlyase transcriptional activator
MIPASGLTRAQRGSGTAGSGRRGELVQARGESGGRIVSGGEPSRRSLLEPFPASGHYSCYGAARAATEIAVPETRLLSRAGSSSALEPREAAQMSVELKHPHETLQQREDWLRFLVDHAAEAFFVGQAQGRIIDANRTACDELGYGRDELLALSAWDVVEEFTPTGFAALFEELATHGPRTLTVSHRRKDGSRYPVEGRVCVAELQGAPVLFVLTRDITERQREAVALRESEDKFRKIFNHSNDGGFLLDPACGAILDVNPSACGMLGYTREELLALHISDVHPDEMPGLASFTEAVLADGTGWTDALTCLTKWGEKLPAEVSGSVVSLDGQPRIVVWVREISARKKAEAALRESEERFRLLVEHAADAFYVMEEGGRIVDVNERACQATGYTRHELLTMFVWDVSVALPPERFGDLWKRAGAGGSVTTSSIHRRKDGTTFPVEAHGCLVEARGRQYLLGLVRDVSERVRAEQERRKLEVRLGRILESAMDAIVTVDAGRRITLFNQAAEKVFHCSAAEALGTSVERFLSPRFRELVAAQAAGGADPTVSRPLWVSEGLSACRADGEEFPVEATVSRAEASGEIFHTIILRDVNERHRAEAELRKVQLERRYLQEEIDMELNVADIVGASPALQRALRDVARVAGTDSTVLITGETGTGKERIARAIHEASNRRNRVLVKVNCAALPSGLIESELFGHEKGAFTGALSRRIGRFELADGGTIFLDEIGDLPPELQAKLLHVLQEGEFERVGGTRTLKVDARVIAATNRDLEKAVADDRFRADLYYRLKVFPIHVPPLRERTEDIPLLVRYFARMYGAKLGKRLDTIPQERLDALVRYQWPGNVRELGNVIERAAILSRGNELDLSDWLTRPGAQAPPQGILTLDDMQRRHIVEVLKRTGWRVSGAKGAAHILALKPSTLRARMHKLGIRREP